MSCTVLYCFVLYISPTDCSRGSQRWKDRLLADAPLSSGTLHCSVHYCCLHVPIYPGTVKYSTNTSRYSTLFSTLLLSSCTHISRYCKIQYQYLQVMFTVQYITAISRYCTVHYHFILVLYSTLPLCHGGSAQWATLCHHGCKEVLYLRWWQ